jgi:hypothetical protein
VADQVLVLALAATPVLVVDREDVSNLDVGDVPSAPGRIVLLGDVGAQELLRRRWR